MSRSRTCALVSILIFFVTAGSVADEVKSLRGATAIEENSAEPARTRWMDDKEPIARDYVQQPPLVPHSIDKHEIDLNSNKCMTCHSWAEYLLADATKISQTHFADREGDVLATLAGRRYFCKQCHVSQKDTEPLVENIFEPVEAVSQ